MPAVRDASYCKYVESIAKNGRPGGGRAGIKSTQANRKRDLRHGPRHNSVGRLRVQPVATLKSRSRRGNVASINFTSRDRDRDRERALYVDTDTSK